MTFPQEIATIAICAAASMTTRFLPFLLFSPGKNLSPYIRYLGGALPAAVFALLVIYCLKDVSWMTGNHGAPELLGIAATVLTHLKYKNFMISMVVGTATYMLLVQLLFL